MERNDFYWNHSAQAAIEAAAKVAQATARLGAKQKSRSLCFYQKS
jgi:hypothetical protein